MNMKTSLTDVNDYLEKVRIPLRLACRTESGWPSILSLWFLYRNERIYCASRASSRVVAYLRSEPRCAFEIAGDEMPYCGIRAQAIASLDEGSGADILKALLLRYLGGLESSLAKDLLAKNADEVAIVLKPLQVFTWNFSSRMQDTVSETNRDRICP